MKKWLNRCYICSTTFRFRSTAAFWADCGQGKTTRPQVLLLASLEAENGEIFDCSSFGQIHSLVQSFTEPPERSLLTA